MTRVLSSIGFALLSLACSAAGRILAFPGAVGGGKYATGGRGGSVYHVTNLNDSGTGSFRDAVSAGHRIVVFDVSGTIELKSNILCRGNITIAGQTAPGGSGITLKNYKMGMSGDNIICRYMSSRPGPYKATSSGNDAWGGSNGSNSMIDHCSIGWATDELWGLYSNNENYTVQYSVIGPADSWGGHAKGLHGFGMMLGKGNCSFDHNLIVHNISRNFRGKVEGTMTADFSNNVIYDWGYQTAYGTIGHLNYVNNTLKAGNSTTGAYRWIAVDSTTKPQNFKVYCAGNRLINRDGSLNSVTDDNWSGVSVKEGIGITKEDLYSTSAFGISDDGENTSSVLTAENAADAYEHVLTYAGNGTSSDKRTAIDRQCADETRNGTGSCSGTAAYDDATAEEAAKLDSYAIQCGVTYTYPTAVAAKEIVDTDNDGMPDAWELARGLDPNDASDYAGDYCGQGYMNIEYYLNDLTVDSFPAGTVTLSPTVVTDEKLYIGCENGKTETRTIRAGSFEASDIRIGANGGIGTLNLIGGVITQTVSSAGTTHEVQLGAFGTESVATINQTGGEVYLGQGNVSLGREGGRCVYNLSGGKLVSLGAEFGLGSKIGWDANLPTTYGELNVSGTAEAEFRTLSLGGLWGWDNSGTGVVNQVGGKVSAGELNLGRGRTTGYGIYTLSGGTLAAKNVYFSHNNWGHEGKTCGGEFNLCGGILETEKILYSDYSSGATQEVRCVMNFDGGTLRFKRGVSSSAIDAHVCAVIGAGGAKIDTNGFNVNMTNGFASVANDGGLVKKGAGTLTLSSAALAFTGPIKVEEGTLVLSAQNRRITADGKVHYLNASLETWNVDIGTTNRTYAVYRPKTIAAKPALVFSLHGMYGHSADCSPFSREVADEAGCIVVYPQGVERKLLGGMNTGWLATGEANDDLDFFLAIIGAVAEQYPIDRKRIYCCGFSNGGMMTYSVSQTAADTFAAFASISGFQLNEFHHRITGSRPVPFLHIHGKADGFVPYAKSQIIRDRMVARNGCDPVPTVTGEEGRYTKSVYAAGAGSFPYVYYACDGMGHNDATSRTEDGSAARTMWKFMSQYTLDSACDRTLKWRNNPDAAGWDALAHGWESNNFRRRFVYGSGYVSGNVYHSLQFEPGEYRLVVSAQGKAGNKVYVRLTDTDDDTVLFCKAASVGSEATIGFTVDRYRECKILVEKESNGDRISAFAIYSSAARVESVNAEDAVLPEVGTLVEIPQDQGRELDSFDRATMEVKDGYTEYVTSSSVAAAFKMANVDVTNCDYILFRFAEPVAAGWSAAFWNSLDSREIPEGSTEYRFELEPSMKANGVIPQICLLTVFSGQKPLVAKVAGVYKHTSYEFDGLGVVIR